MIVQMGTTEEGCKDVGIMICKLAFN